MSFYDDDKKGYVCVDPKIQKEVKEKAAKIGGEEFVMDLGDGYKVVNLVSWDKAEKEEAEIGRLSGFMRELTKYDYEYGEKYVCYACPGKDENDNIQFYDAMGNVSHIYAIHDEHDKPSAIMLIRNGFLKEFKVKEPSVENLSHVRKFAECLNKAYVDTFLKLFVDGDKCNAPEGFVIRGNSMHRNTMGQSIITYHDCLSKGGRVFPDLSKVIVEGDLDVSNSNLYSLEKMPEKITGSFDCSGNKLKNLKGGPKEVGKHYNCSHNPIKDYGDIPGKLKEMFIFEHYYYYKEYDAEHSCWKGGWETECVGPNMDVTCTPAWKLEFADRIYGKSHNHG